MRDVKFRAWDVTDSRMYYNITNLSDINGFLMQYAGLKDKNGCEIYEGDIVIYKYASYKDISIVRFNEKNAQFVFVSAKPHEDNTSWNRFKDGRMHDFSLVIPSGYFDYVEIIGNVYENSDLLEESE